LTAAHIVATEGVCLQIGDARNRMLRYPIVSCMKIELIMKYSPTGTRNQNGTVRLLKVEKVK
jgi:hypothetical protein